MTGNTLVTLEERAKLTSATDFAVLIPPSLHTNFSPCAGSLREDVVQPTAHVAHTMAPVWS